MSHKMLRQLLVLLVLVGTVQGMEAQIFKKKKAKTEENKDAKPKEGEIQPYDKVITKEAKTDTGLFDVHTVKDKHYDEIPDSLFGRDMMIVIRFTKSARDTVLCSVPHLTQ